MTDKLKAFATKYRKLAKRMARDDDAAIFVYLPSHELTAHASVNRHLTWAFRHAVNGETSHFEACMQDARSEFKRIREEALASLDDEDGTRHYGHVRDPGEDFHSDG